jgi:hypothetical protein
MKVGKTKFVFANAHLAAHQNAGIYVNIFLIMDLFIYICIYLYTYLSVYLCIHTCTYIRIHMLV